MKNVISNAGVNNRQPHISNLSPSATPRWSCQVQEKIAFPFVKMSYRIFVPYFGQIAQILGQILNSFSLQKL